jgi:ZIP family zinc transporter
MEALFQSWVGEYAFVLWAFIAGILASLACGLGALPLAFSGLRLQERVGLGYAFAAGLMFSASVYNLLMPAFTMGPAGATDLAPVLKTLGGMAAGAAFLWGTEKYLTADS